MTDADESPEPGDGGKGPRMSRRAVVATLAGAGAFAAMGAGETAFESGGGTVLGIGGGDMADAAQEFRVKYYVGTKAELPSAGVEGRVWHVYDPGGTDHGAVFYDNGSSWVVPSFGSSTTPVPSVTTEQADIKRFRHQAKFVVEWDPDAPSSERWQIYGPDNNLIEQGSSGNLVPALQEIEDDTHAEVDGPLKSVHFTPDPSFPVKFFSPLTIKNSLHVTGNGRNRTNIELADGVDDDLFVLDDPASDAIFEFSHLKLFGNKGNNTSGSGINVQNAFELIFNFFESRSFPEHGVYYNDPTSNRWCQATGSWFLDNGIGDFTFGGSTGNTDPLEEFTFANCMINSTISFGGLRFEAGAVIENISWVGGRFRGSNPVEIDAPVEKLTIDGANFTKLDNNAGIRYRDQEAQTDVNHVIDDCTFEVDSGDPSSYYIRVIGDWRGIDIGTNRYESGFTGVPVQIGNTGQREYISQAGTYYSNGTPSAANYGAGDAGKEVIDTSTTPEDLYKILDDGTLSGAV